MRSLGYALIQYDWFLYIKRKAEHRCAKKRWCENTDKHDHPPAKKKGLKQILPSWPSEEINPYNASTSEFNLPELWENKSLMLEQPVYGTLLW